MATNPFNRPRRRSRRSQNWSSSVVGTHARPSVRANDTSRFSRVRDVRGGSSRGDYTRRGPSLDGRTAEVRQVRPTGVSGDGGHNSRRNRRVSPAQAARSQHRASLIRFGIIGVLVLALAFFLGSCAFRASIGGGFALDDATVKESLVAPETDEEPYVILVAGFGDDGKASYLELLRIDPVNKTMSFLDIPGNIPSGKGQLRDLSATKTEGDLVERVTEITGIPIAHYYRITDEGFVKLVDALGGLDVNITQRIDDPRVSTRVLDAGEQTLSGEDALVYVRAYNYPDGKVTRGNVQYEVVKALIAKMTERSGISFMQAADALANASQTDLSYDQLADLADLFDNCTSFMHGTMPGTEHKASDNRTYFSIGNDWEQVKEYFLAGKEPVVDHDTGNVNKKKVSIVVLNGSGVSGNAGKVQEALEAAGYEVQETGNAEQFVYDETLVVYRDAEDKAAAEAIVADLGVGRVVSSGVNYNLSTNIQIMVGNDWVS